MPNRIEELLWICTERVPYYPAGNNGHPEYSIEFNKQRFAELLIKECIKIANRGVCDLTSKLKKSHGKINS